MNDEPKDIRLSIMATRSEPAAIDDWRFENRIPSRAGGIRTLIKLGRDSQAVPLNPVGSRDAGSNPR